VNDATTERRGVFEMERVGVELRGIFVAQLTGDFPIAVGERDVEDEIRGGGIGMPDDEGLAAIGTYAADSLPTAQVLDVLLLLAEAAGTAVLDDGPDFAVEGHGLFDDGPLFRGKRGDVAREAEPAQEPGAEGVVETLGGVFGMKHGPDLRFFRRNEALQVRANPRNFGTFVRVGKAAHRRGTDHKRLEAMAAGRAILDDEIGQFLLDFLEEAVNTHEVLAQAFTQTVRIVATDADSIVVIDLEIAETFAAKKLNDPFREKIDDPWIAKIPEAAETGLDDVSVPLEQMLGFFKNLRAIGNDFKFEPDAGNLSIGAERRIQLGKALGKFFRMDFPITVGGLVASDGIEFFGPTRMAAGFR